MFAISKDISVSYRKYQYLTVKSKINIEYFINTQNLCIYNIYLF